MVVGCFRNSGRARIPGNALGEPSRDVGTPTLWAWGRRGRGGRGVFQKQWARAWRAWAGLDSGALAGVHRRGKEFVGSQTFGGGAGTDWRTI